MERMKTSFCEKRHLDLVHRKYVDVLIQMIITNYYLLIYALKLIRNS